MHALCDNKRGSPEAASSVVLKLVQVLPNLRFDELVHRGKLLWRRHRLEYLRMHFGGMHHGFLFYF